MAMKSTGHHLKTRTQTEHTVPCILNSPGGILTHPRWKPQLSYACIRPGQKHTLRTDVKEQRPFSHSDYWRLHFPAHGDAQNGRTRHWMLVWLVLVRLAAFIRNRNRPKLLETFDRSWLSLLASYVPFHRLHRF